MAQADAIVVGAGPNGLAAAIAIAQTGRKVVVLERAAEIGGGCRSAALTLPGFVHDICSAVHPFAVASPFFRSLPLAAHGLEWIEPAAMLAHPFDGDAAVVVYRSVERTAEQLGVDADAYRDLFNKLAGAWPKIELNVLGPIGWPRHPLALAGFGLKALQSARRFARRTFKGAEARALFAGSAAHSMLPLDRAITAGVGLALALLTHTSGWVLPKGGAQCLANALASYLRSLGGEIVTGVTVTSADDLPAARAVLFDLSPRPLLRIAGDGFPPRYRRALERYRYGMGVFKADWALEGPIPWRNRDVARAGTVHLGGTLDEIASSENDAWNGRHSEQPFVLLAQPTLFDPSRAPAGRHVVWTYCHVPHASTEDMLPRVEAQIERFAPGFRKRVLACNVMAPADVERHNPNYVGGDIGGGAGTLWQLAARPTWRHYSTPVRGWYICSASTPPGVGVHGMCGYFAAQRALRDVL
ncbi:MAG TPA: NAD(P)/FAD-dependent oxidoreductase [Vicinamibacterales bacterium]|nr:NAD(P)/FAD-dependent oxidoreductase [Vicinamibacterales bacterium]